MPENNNGVLTLTIKDDSIVATLTAPGKSDGDWSETSKGTTGDVLFDLLAIMTRKGSYQDELVIVDERTKR